MARTSDPHSATAQFFINAADNEFLNFKSRAPQGWGYAVFGRVVAGNDVVDAIEKVQTGRKGGHDDVPLEDVTIHRAPPSSPDGRRAGRSPWRQRRPAARDVRRAADWRAIDFISDLHLAEDDAAHLRGLGAHLRRHRRRRRAHPRRPVRGLGRRRRARRGLRGALRRGAAPRPPRGAWSASWPATAISCVGADDARGLRRRAPRRPDRRSCAFGDARAADARRCAVPRRRAYQQFRARRARPGLAARFPAPGPCAERRAHRRAAARRERAAQGAQSRRLGRRRRASRGRLAAGGRRRRR